MDKKIKFYKVLDYILCFFLLLLSIKKGGFYKSDSILFNLAVNIIAVMYISILYIKKNSRKEKSKIGILILLFSIAYLFPIILNNYTSLNDSIFEMIRYFNIYLIYIIVKKSNNKKIYIYSIIFMATFLVILGIDQISKGYATDFLTYFNSGYLTSNNVNRMSSTIQYANVFSLICLIAYILTFANDINDKKYITNISRFLLLSGIILSESRITILLTILVTIYEILKNKNISKKHLVFTIIYTFIFIVLINKFISNNLNTIYIVSGIACCLNIVFTYILINFNKEIRFIFEKKFIKNILIFFGIVFCIRCFNLHTDILLSSSSDKSFITRNIYRFNKNESNNLEIIIDELEEDTRYEIEVFVVNNNNASKLVKKLYYYSTTTGKFNIDIENEQNIKYINVNINCTKGSMKIKNISINGKKVAMDYMLLPSNLVYRIIDGFHTSNSFNYRIQYQKDALKIITSSYKNFIFGIGGEGFRNQYKYFKTIDYNSTEVHNIYIQIFLESGIIGLLLFIWIIIYILKKYKMNTKKLALICILVHGIFDLDFSYMIVLAIFGILIGLLELKDEKNNIKESNILNYIKLPLGISMWGITTMILLLSNLATFVKLYSITDLDNIESIESKITNYEKIVSLDWFEPKYRLKLNEAYLVYLNKLNEYNISDNYNKNYIDSLQKNILSNLEYMQKNEAINTSNVIDISNQYFNNLVYLTNLKYPIDLDNLYNHHLDIIYSNMLKLYSINDKELKLKVKNVCSKYIEAFEKINNNTIYNYKIKLENLLSI